MEASSEGTVEERQENELQLLLAVYMDDVSDLRKSEAWKVWRPLDLAILLRPQESMHAEEAHVSIILHVVCSNSYPEQMPELKLEKPNGLSYQLVSKLLTELKDLAKSLIGEVMILELCQHIQSFLHTHNCPPPTSFYEQMLLNQRRQDEENKRERDRQQEILRQIEEKQGEEIEAEILKIQEAKKEQTRLKREIAKQAGIDRRSMSSDPSTPESMGKITPIAMDSQQRFRTRSSMSPDARQATNNGSFIHPERRRRTSTPVHHRTSEGDSGCDYHKGTSILAFDSKKERTVYRGACLGHSARGSTVYSGMDTQTGELVAIVEWNIKWRSFKRKLNLQEKEEDQKEGSKYLKQLTSIEQELLSFSRLHHPNLVHYQAVKYEQENGMITLYILMDFASGGNLNYSLLKAEPLPMERITVYCCQLLEALGYLHNKAVVHKDLRASSILLDSKGKVRLTDYSIGKRLADLVCEADSGRPGVKFDGGQAVTLGRGGKKADVYRVGMLLLSLAEGKSVSDLPEVPSSLPAEFQDFLTKCLIHDEHHRWSISQLSDHSFAKTPFYIQPEANHKDQNGEDRQKKDEEEEEEEEEIVIPLLQNLKGNGQSRLTSEFEVLKWLGKGGFGDVIKVRNKLDSRYYAIKRIPLIPNRKNFTKKITREVKLLSRLNHENVVRYYNSWIESSNEPIPQDSLASTLTTIHSGSSASPPSQKNSPPQSRGDSVMVNSLGIPDPFGALSAPSPAGGYSEWGDSISESKEEEEEEEEEDSFDDSDSGDVFGTSFLPFDDDDDDDDDGIDFEQNVDWSSDQVSLQTSSQQIVERAYEEHRESPDVKETPRLKFLYIQMEFCEKSTLRNVIDAGVYQDVDRVWQLFREIIEGLLHIHEQGMIHRDLKPVNIFLDSNDHVKIGDFGLATTDIIAKQQNTLVDLTINPSVSCELKLSVSSKSDSMDDGGGLTGKVGTALYVSPEMSDTQKRTHYNQKVDIYSLGIMFFEMCYRPLNTGMERVKILTNLRQPSIELPADFDEATLQNQAFIVRWLLNHNPMLRPTCKELLQSDRLPPPPLQEAELNEVLRSAIANPESKCYKHMLNAVFSQPLTPAMDFTYDSDFYRTVGNWSLRPLLAQHQVTDVLERVFRRHGAVRLTSPLLMPCDANVNESHVRLMDHSGSIVGLPYDLRASFARYVARHGVSHLKRYTMERVFRESRLHGLHPRELTACAFDVVTPNTASLVPDAEVLCVVSEIIAEFPRLQGRNFYLRINHTALLRAILVHCGIAEELHSEVHAILSDSQQEKHRKLQIQTRLCSLSLSDDTVDALNSFIQIERPYAQASSFLRKITKSKGPAASLAKKGLHEMEAIISHAQLMACSLEPVLAVGLVYSVHQFSGVIYQVVADVRRKKRTLLDVFAAGGRYDALISRYRKPGSAPVFQCVVGISLSFDKILAAQLDGDCDNSLPTRCDVLVCSIGHKAMLREKMSMIKDLWAAGLHAELHLDATQLLEDVQNHCRANEISHLVIFKDLEATVKVKSLDAEKVMEKRLAPTEVADYLLTKISQATNRNDLQDTSLGSSKLQSLASNLSTENCTCLNSINQYGGCGSSSGNSAGALPSVNITLVPFEKEKLAKNTKRVFEAQISSNLSRMLCSLHSKQIVDIIGIELNVAVLRTIAAHIEISNNEKAFEEAASAIAEKHPRFKKYLTKVFDTIHDIREQRDRNSQRNSVPLIILYGLKDDSFKLLL